MGLLRNAMSYALKNQMVVDVTPSAGGTYKEFESIPPVAQWLAMLNASNTLHPRAAGYGTRRTYGYALQRLNNWLPGRKWSISVRESTEDGYYKDVHRDIEIRDVGHLLKLALEKGGIDRDLSAVIRKYFADMNGRKELGQSAMVLMHSAIRSFFTSHEIQYGLRIPRHMLRGSGRGGQGDSWEDRTLKLSEFARMLSVGKPSIRDKAALLAKFHRGLDTATLADRFNYTAFDQIAAHMGTDDPQSWSLDKCPVPIVLTRVKTDFKHTGFLERDAVAANIEWIAERERLTGKPLRRGDGQPLYITRRGRPVASVWAASQFSRLAIKAGLCTKAPGGYLLNTRRSHQLRHLLKSTLIDAGCRIDVADHVIGHSPKDAYEQQAVLYPDSLRREYAKASHKINIFSNFEASLDGSDDIHSLRAEIEADHKRLKAALAAAEAREKSVAGNGAGGGGGIDASSADAIAALQEDMRRLQESVGRGNGKRKRRRGRGAGHKYQCIPCSLVHSSAACPSCGSAERCMYEGGGGR